ncbi:cupin domain-containing protein [Hyphomonas sp. WL0036]|uniref:cupin domain-containing protein n=1 Tax=Hyphomonas sediminis TaxID=2866160 RepID=UPI001C804BF0|nr:cupin domain-containing protein [Hyphomonas sediminis]MBY9068318.1 cupin domain-containing protein [Hyphomonas sediminis]
MDFAFHKATSRGMLKHRTLDPMMAALLGGGIKCGDTYMQIKSTILPALALSLAACAHHAHGHMHHHDHAGASAVDHSDKLVRAATGHAVDNPFHPVRLLLSSEESAGDVTVYEFLLPPRSPGSPPHTHSLEDEYFFVVSGTLDVLSNGQVLRLNPGDFAALNRGHAHMFWNGSDAPTELIMITTGGSFETFMNGAGPRIAEAKPESAEDFGAVISQLAAEHGITISMEKMPVEAAEFYMPPSAAAE